MNRQLRALTGNRADLIHVCEIKLRVDALAIQIHRHGHDIHVASSLAVTQQRAFNAIGARHDAELRRRNCAAAVVVGM